MGIRETERNQKKTHKLAEYEFGKRILRTYPVTTKAHSLFIFEEKYSFEIITLEDQPPMTEQLSPDNKFPFGSLPSGFVRDPFDGLGLIYPLRHIIYALDQFRDVDEIVFCKDELISRSGKSIRLPYKLYDVARKTLNRIHDTALNFAEEDKNAYLRENSCLHFYLIPKSKELSVKMSRFLEISFAVRLITQARGPLPLAMRNLQLVSLVNQQRILLLMLPLNFTN